MKTKVPPRSSPFRKAKTMLAQVYKLLYLEFGLVSCFFLIACFVCFRVLFVCFRFVCLRFCFSLHFKPLTVL